MSKYKIPKQNEKRLLQRLHYIDFNEYIHCDDQTSILHHLDLDYSSDALIYRTHLYDNEHVYKFMAIKYNLDNRAYMDKCIAYMRKNCFYTAGIRIRQSKFHDEYGINSITLRQTIHNGTSIKENLTEIDHILDRKVDFIYYAYLKDEEFLPFVYKLDCRKLNDRNLFTYFHSTAGADSENDFMSLKDSGRFLIERISI